MPDDRTKREKIEAWLAPNSGKTEAEKKAARKWLADNPGPIRARPGPNINNYSYRPPTGEAARPAGRQYRAYRDPGAGPDDPVWVDFDFEFGLGDEFWRKEADELLRRAQQRERVRRHDIKFPGDPGFEGEFTAQTASFQESMRKMGEAAKNFDEAVRRQNEGSKYATGTRGEAMRRYLEGKIRLSELSAILEELDRDGT